MPWGGVSPWSTRGVSRWDAVGVDGVLHRGLGGESEHRLGRQQKAVLEQW